MAHSVKLCEFLDKTSCFLLFFSVKGEVDMTVYNNFKSLVVSFSNYMVLKTICYNILATPERGVMR